MTTTNSKRDFIATMSGVGLLIAVTYFGFSLREERAFLMHKLVTYTEFTDGERGISRSDKDDLARRLLQAEFTIYNFPHPPSSRQLADNPYRRKLLNIPNLEIALYSVHTDVLREVLASYQTK